MKAVFSFHGGEEEQRSEKRAARSDELGRVGNQKTMEDLHMKKWKIAAAAACVCFLLTAAYAANAGGADDPLVTLSYLNTTFRNQVQTMVDETVDTRKSEMEDALSKVLEQGGTGTGEGGSGSVFSVVTLKQGQILEGDVGCEVMLRIGSAVCGTPGTVGLIDTTTGGNLANGASLDTNHLYMITISTRTVTATSGTAMVLVRGPYTIR